MSGYHNNPYYYYGSGGRGFSINNASLVRAPDSTFFYNVGATPHFDVLEDSKAKTDKFLKELLIYGGVAAVLLYVIYGKK
jgi:hypothetical protein